MAGDRTRRPPPVLKWFSDFGLLRHLQRIIDLDAEVSDRALQLGMTEQQVNRPEILGSPVDQCRLGPAHRVGSVIAGVQSDASDPGFHDPRILPCRNMR